MVIAGLRRGMFVTVLVVMAGTAVGLTAGQDDKDQKDRKDERRPSLSLKASPMLAFSPARLSFTAELRGGSNDYEEYYCPTVEWDWGDGTKSESTIDCDPYEAGKSEIRRRFTTIHLYRVGGNYKVQVRLKRKDKVMTSAVVSIEVRPGLRDGFY
jgi:hypothetical protein